MIDIEAIRLRWQQVEPFLDERSRRLFAADAALTAGHGGIAAVSEATGVARSTIKRGIDELRSGRNEIGSRVRRPGGGRKVRLNISQVCRQPSKP